LERPQLEQLEWPKLERSQLERKFE